MNDKIAILTDSTSDLTREFLEQNDIFMIPLKVVYPDREYLDCLEIAPQEVYDRMPGEIPTTSTPSLGEIAAALKDIVAKGYRKIISIHISSGLSSTFSHVSMIAQDIMSETPGVQIEVIDGLNVSYGTAMLVRIAAKCAALGMGFDEICQRVDTAKREQRTFFILKTLHYLHKGGRIGHVSHMLGSLLDLKPIVSVGKDGVYYTVGKARGYQKSVDKLIELASETADKMRCKIAVLQGDAMEEAKYVFHTLQKRFGDAVFYLGAVGPVVGVHTGPGTLGIVVTPYTEIL
jgi:DegV family protein with EDD domain